LLEATAEVRQKKFGVENEEFIEGMVGIAVPVNDDKNRIVAALILSTTS
jgi:IclR family transcriptional regulator, acetate operon repressor